MLIPEKLVKLGNIYRRALLLNNEEVKIKEVRNEFTDAIVSIGRKHVLAISEIEGKWHFIYGKRAKYVTHGVWKMTTIGRKKRKVNLLEEY